MSLSTWTATELMDEMKRRGLNSADYARHLSPLPLPACMYCGRQAKNLFNAGQRGYRCTWDTGCMKT